MESQYALRSIRKKRDSAGGCINIQNEFSDFRQSRLSCTQIDIFRNKSIILVVLGFEKNSTYFGNITLKYVDGDKVIKYNLGESYFLLKRGAFFENVD